MLKQLNQSRCHLGCGWGWVQGTMSDVGDGGLDLPAGNDTLEKDNILSVLWLISCSSASQILFILYNGI